MEYSAEETVVFRLPSRRCNGGNAQNQDVRGTLNPEDVLLIRKLPFAYPLPSRGSTVYLAIPNRSVLLRHAAVPEWVTCRKIKCPME